jgi:peptide/nickel transport system substrate-binding protein
MAAAAVGLVLAAAGPTTPAHAGAGGGTLRIGMGSEAESLDPPNFLISADFTRMDLIFDRLVRVENDGTIVPSLATEWTQVDDVTWEFSLRDDVTFHDGTPFNAEAVRFVLDRSRTQEQGEAFLGVIAEVEVVDEFTVRLQLQRPFAAILNNLATPVSGIYSPASIEEFGDQVSQHPVGTGPYRFVEWQVDTRLVLEANADYWGDAPTLDRVEFIPIPEAATRMSALQAGEIDVIENPPPEEVANIEASGDLELINEPKARPVFLGFNLEAVSDVRVRRAIAHAIDRELIVEAVLEGIGTPATEGIIPPFLREGQTPVAVGYDPDAAGELLAEAEVDGLTLRVVVPTERYLRDTAVVEVIQAQLSEIGITLELDIRDTGAWYQALLDRDTELYWLGWGLNALDPGDLFTRVFASGAVNNMSQLNSPEVDALIAELETAPMGSEERAALLTELERLIVEEEVVVVPIYHAANLFAATSMVANFHTTPAELLDLSAVTIG